MIFGRVPLTQARGGILAHNLKTADRVLRKGALIDPAIHQMLEDAGYTEVTIARLEPGDVPEGEAATRLAEALRHVHLRRSNDVHGRVNLFAETPGLLRVDAGKIERLNSIDEAITLATLPDRAVVAAGDMIATLKIIPFAVAGDAMDAGEALIAEGAPALILKPFQPLRVGLILTELPHLKDAAIVYTIEATRARIASHGGILQKPVRAPHELAYTIAAINEVVTQDIDLILISGASAVTDRLDIAPQAIIAAGGKITHFGMPVDPGNLICFGKIGARHAIVLPGCARSPKLNGFDWVLDSIFAGEDPIENIARLGVGGLLKEIETRPAPRARTSELGFGLPPKSKPRIAALVLAAGLSSRMAPANKLLERLANGHQIIAQTVDNVLASTANPVIVVTGHQAPELQKALQNRPVRFVHAADYAAGMAASLAAGVQALADSLGGVLICLGDMPLVAPEALNHIIAAFDPAEGREIILPIFDGQRGNPVLWGKRFFPELAALKGDAGARQILHKHMEYVTEILMGDDATLRDFDTKEALD